MFRATVDQFEKSMERGGFSGAFRHQVIAARKREAIAFAKQADIDAAKRIMHDRSMPRWVIEVLLECAEKHGVSPSLIAGRSSRKPVVLARNEVFYTIKSTKPMLSTPRISRWFGRDHTSILYSLAKYALVNGLPAFTRYDFTKRHASTAAFYRRTQEAGK